MEIWKKISSIDNYEVSSLGRVRSCDRIICKTYKNGVVQSCTFKGKIMKTPVNDLGYKRINICRRYLKVHRLVVEAFIGEIGPGFVVNHKNGVKTDNRIENLEIVTYSENLIHAVKNNLIKNFGGSKNLNKEEVNTIKFFYNHPKRHRNCASILGKVFDRSSTSIRNIARGRLDNIVS